MTLVIDLYSGPGGVGCALAGLGFEHVGVDLTDYSDTYPGTFIRADASDVPFISKLPSPALLWMSPPCQAYSELSWCNSTRLGFDDPKEYYPTFDDLNVRQVLDALDPDHYIIENVRKCDDLRDPVRLDGLAFGLGFRLERHFETSFDVPDAIGVGSPETVVQTKIGMPRSKNELARRKSIPTSWEESEVRSAMPPEYVRYLLHYCPATPGVACPAVNRQAELWEMATDGGFTKVAVPGNEGGEDAT